MQKNLTVDQLELLKKIYPLDRHIISDGYDAALNILEESFPLKLSSFRSGTKCWTWTVPQKWTCHEGYIETLDGKRILDYKDNPLYVASYSEPVNEIMDKDELLQHIHTHPYLDDAPPFIFYYYQAKWGFCIEKNRLSELTDAKYKVVIDSVKEEGFLKTAEYDLQGAEDKWFVICAHIDHPVQSNDGLSGVVTGLAIIEELKKQPELNYSYKLLILPETIGSITWLSQNESFIPKIIGGIFLDMTGLDIAPGLQRSYFGNTRLDKIFSAVHEVSEEDAWVADYRFLVGNDERQFNSPGVRIPMLSYARAHPWGHPHRPYKEYHSSKDNIAITNAQVLERSKDAVLKMILTLDKDYYPKNLFKGEVFLSGQGIEVDRHKYLDLHRNLLKIMDMIDGTNSIFEISLKLNIDFEDVLNFCEVLYEKGLISKSKETI